MVPPLFFGDARMSRKKDADPDTQIASEGFVEEFVTKPTFDEDGVQVSSAIGPDGKEYPDPVPMAPPVGFGAPPDLMDMMRKMITSYSYQARLDAEGFDTEEEASDFDIDDDPLPPLTLHEAIMMPPSPAAPAAPSPPPVEGAAPPSDAAKGGVASPPPVTPPVPST